MGGVTEPALYGLGLRYRRPLIGLAAGGFVGGIWAGTTHVTAYIMGSSSFLSILGYVGGGALNTLNAGISDLLAMSVATAVTYATWRDSNEERLGRAAQRELRAKAAPRPQRTPAPPQRAFSQRVPYEKNLLTRSREYSAVSSMSPKAMTSPA